MTQNVYDVVIVGGGIGGLTAASYLGRFHRPTLVIDAGASRARWIPVSHNILGFPEGVGGKSFLAKLRAQAEGYGASIVSGEVTSITQTDQGFRLVGAGREIVARYVLLATGVEDHLPSLDGAEEALLRSVLRVCPVCDGYEASGKRIAVLGTGIGGEHEAAFLKTYSKRVTYLHLDRPDNNDGRAGRMSQQSIELLEASLEDLTIRSVSLQFRSKNAEREFDVFYAALGCKPRSDLAARLGATCDEKGAIVVNEHQMSSVDGIYAVGDQVRGLNQVIVAAAEAAIAATDTHNRLRR